MEERAIPDFIQRHYKQIICYHPQKKKKKSSIDSRYASNHVINEESRCSRLKFVTRDPNKQRNRNKKLQQRITNAHHLDRRIIRDLNLLKRTPR